MNGSGSIGRFAAVAAIVVVLVAPAAYGVELTGGIRVDGGRTDSGPNRVETLDERYNLRLQQSLSPFLGVELDFRYNRFRNRPDFGVEFERQSNEPRIAFTYNRPNLNAALWLGKRRIRGTSVADELDQRQILGWFTWLPRVGPNYTLRYRDEANTADPSIIGRDTAAKGLDFEARYNRDRWNAVYRYSYSQAENRSTGYSLKQNRNELRGDYSQKFWRERFRFTFDGWVSRTSQDEQIPENATLAEPIEPRMGLYTVDVLPDIGELDPRPDVIDGDTETAEPPPIDIGGANTYRNVGLDLGITRPVTRLQVWVDAPSDPLLAWDVYESPDNLAWNRIDGSLADYDGGFLQYEIVIPETTNRFFKVVNVSVNSFTGVRVTEIRALVDVGQFGRANTTSTTYQAYTGLRFDPNERVAGSITLGSSNEKNLRSGFTVRDLTYLTYMADFRFEFTRDLNLLLVHRISDQNEGLDPGISRTERAYSASLTWTPLPTVNTLLGYNHRTEDESGALIRASDSVRFRATTTLLPELQLVSDLSYNDVEDPFSGFNQNSFRWAERIETRPRRNWTVGGGFWQTWYDSDGGPAIRRRLGANLRTSWQATPYLTFSGTWNYGRDDEKKSLTQIYNAFWAPGPRLSLSLYYRESGSEELRTTTSSGGRLNYRFPVGILLWANLTRSKFEQLGVAGDETTTLRVGLSYYF